MNDESDFFNKTDNNDSEYSSNEESGTAEELHSEVENTDDSHDEEKETNGTESTKHSVKGRYVLLALLFLILTVLVGFYESRSVIIKKVTVGGDFYTSTNAIIKKADIPADAKPDSLNLLAISKRVEQLPYIRRAFIRIIPPDQLHIQVTERHPIALLISGNHEMYVDTSGVKMPVVPGKIINAPLVYGFKATDAGDTVKSAKFKTVCHFLENLQKHHLAQITLSEVTYTTKYGVVAISQNNGVKVIFGNNNFDQRLTYWDAFYRQVVPKKGINKFLFVDLRYKGQVVTNKL